MLSLHTLWQMRYEDTRSEGSLPALQGRADARESRLPEMRLVSTVTSGQVCANGPAGARIPVSSKTLTQAGLFDRWRAF